MTKLDRLWAIVCGAVAFTIAALWVWSDYDLWLWQYPEHTYKETSWWHDYNSEAHKEWQERCESLRQEGEPSSRRNPRELGDPC